MSEKIKPPYVELLHDNTKDEEQMNGLIRFLHNKGKHFIDGVKALSGGKYIKVLMNEAVPSNFVEVGMGMGFHIASLTEAGKITETMNLARLAHYGFYAVENFDPDSIEKVLAKVKNDMAGAKLGISVQGVYTVEASADSVTLGFIDTLNRKHERVTVFTQEI